MGVLAAGVAVGIANDSLWTGLLVGVVIAAIMAGLILLVARLSQR
jgi:hypothetical protein